MDDILIKNFNNLINKEDLTYILGDFTFKNYTDYITKLNGYKILIRGNHDNKIKDDSEYFKNIYNYLEIDYLDYRFILFHYPIHEWNGFNKKNYIHLHGHCHSYHNKQFYQRIPWYKNKLIYNVSVDLNDFKPVLLDNIIKRFNNVKPIK